MGLTEFIKTVKKIFTGDDGEYEDDYRFRDMDVANYSSGSEGDYDEDEVDIEDDGNDDEDDDVRIPESLQRKYQKALDKFYSSLSEKALEDEDLSEMMDDIETKFWEGKIQDPAAAINKVYQKWKTTRSQRNQQKGNNRTIIIDMLRRYDDLTKEEKESLKEYDSKYCVRHLKRGDSETITEILKSWYESKSLTDDKYEIIDRIRESEYDSFPNSSDPYQYRIGEIPLTKDEYNQRLTIFKNDRDELEYYDKYADYFVRYWLESGNQPESIKCNDLIINRPCYLKSKVVLVSPHFHMGQRCFEQDSFQDVSLYLFADAIEYLADGGHFTIKLSEIIDISINNWAHINWKLRNIQRKRDNCQEVKPSDWPDPELLEITCRNQNTTLFSFDDRQAKTDLLVLRALIYYFIKNPHNSEIKKEEPIKLESAKQEPIQQKAVQHETVQQEESNKDSKIFFKPWVGSEYNSGGVYGKKVLVLGESHYGDTPDTTDETIGVVKEFVYEYGGDSYQQTFLCFERALAGREINQEEREQLWNSVMFYNYFQKSTTGPRTGPNMEAQKESEEAFRELLEQYQPDAIIVWGARLYQLLPGWDGTESKIKVGDDSCLVWHYTIKGKKIPAMSVHHPSAPTGKDWTYWHQFHKAFIGEPQFK